MEYWGGGGGGGVSRGGIVVQRYGALVSHSVVHLHDTCGNIATLSALGILTTVLHNDSVT